MPLHSILDGTANMKDVVLDTPQRRDVLFDPQHDITPVMAERLKAYCESFRDCSEGADYFFCFAGMLRSFGIDIAIQDEDWARLDGAFEKARRRTPTPDWGDLLVFNASMKLLGKQRDIDIRERSAFVLSGARKDAEWWLFAEQVIWLKLLDETGMRITLEPRDEPVLVTELKKSREEGLWQDVARYCTAFTLLNDEPYLEKADEAPLRLAMLDLKNESKGDGFDAYQDAMFLFNLSILSSERVYFGSKGLIRIPHGQSAEHVPQTIPTLPFTKRFGEILHH